MEKLTLVTLTGNETLAESTFSNCTSLENIKTTASSFKSGIKNNAFKGCIKLKKVNSSLITKKYSSGEPYFLSTYNSVIRQNWAAIDISGIGFYTDFLNTQVAYIIKTETAGCKTDAQKIKKLHDWVCNKVNYSIVDNKPDPSVECHVDSSAFMRDTTVCDGDITVKRSRF